MRTQRDDLRDALTASLRNEVEAELGELYGQARRRAVQAMADYGAGEHAARMPVACPYDLDRIAGDWLP